MVLDDPVPKEEVVAHFQAPAIQHNPDGWGPCELPDQFKDIPYQPFSKGDRLGKVSVARGLLAPLFTSETALTTHFAVSRRSPTGPRRPSRTRSSQVRIFVLPTVHVSLNLKDREKRGPRGPRRGLAFSRCMCLMDTWRKV